MASFTLTTGADNFMGGADADTFSGPAGGTDTLDGGGGDDLFTLSNNSYGRIDGGSGTDTVFLSGYANVTFSNVEILDGADMRLLFSELTKFTTIRNSADPASLIRLQTVYGGTIDLSTKFEVGQGVHFIGSSGSVDLKGTNVGDILESTQDYDTLDGGPGNDQISYRADGAQFIRGGAGNDTIFASGGSQTLDGGDGNDIFEFYLTSNETVEGGLGTDTAHFSGRADFTQALFSGVEILVADEVFGTFAQIATFSEFRANFGNTIQLTASGAGTLDFTDKIASGTRLQVSPYAADAPIVVTGGGGNDTVGGTNFNDTLSGGQGSDSVVGGIGNDLLRGGAGFGYDYLEGGDGNDRLEGGLGLDTLDGGAGNDTLVGGAGGTTYVNIADDLIVEDVNGGRDTVRHGLSSITLVANVEDLVLTGALVINGTGNASDNNILGNQSVSTLTGLDGNDTLVSGEHGGRLVGGSGADTLLGASASDTLIGGSGADRLIGGLGNDTYIDVTGDTVTEGANGGTDTIQNSAGNFSLDPYANIENLTLTGVSNVNGTGNALNNLITGNTGNNFLTGAGGNDTLEGGGGNDILDGRAGLDRLIGGMGDDLYLDPTGDIVVEASGAGTDTVRSALSFSLATLTYVENLTLTGATAIDGNGNDLANLLTGNSGANVFNAAAGNDTLLGLGGSDRLNGNNGADTLQGGDGRDRLAPADDTFADVIRIISLGESVGVNRDTIIGMDLNGEDLFDLPVTPASIAPNITAGTLNEASFTADLAAVITAAKLGVGQAILFNPSSGTAAYANTIYLIVDGNGRAGYQPGGDYVFQLEAHKGALDTGDFI